MNECKVNGLQKLSCRRCEQVTRVQTVQRHAMREDGVNGVWLLQWQRVIQLWKLRFNRCFRSSTETVHVVYTFLNIGDSEIKRKILENYAQHFWGLGLAILQIMRELCVNYACNLPGYLIHCWYINTKIILNLIQIYNSAYKNLL